MLAGVVSNWEVIRAMFGDTLVKESSVYQHFVEEGRVEGRAEGHREEACLILVGILESRFGTVPPDLRATLDRCPLNTLRELVPDAVSSPSIAAFAQAAAALAPPA